LVNIYSDSFILSSNFHIFNIDDYLNIMDDGKNGGENREVVADSGIIEEKINQPNGEIKIKKYSKGKALGRGGFAKCYEITSL
jgi:hypothetical protein